MSDINSIPQGYADQLHSAHRHRVTEPVEFAVVQVGNFADGNWSPSYQIFRRDPETKAFEVADGIGPNHPMHLEPAQDLLDQLTRSKP